MWDRRIIRGNTYAKATAKPEAEDILQLQREQVWRRTVLQKRRKNEMDQKAFEEALHNEMTRHIPIQTELYLEEISSCIEEADVCIGTDIFLDRPESPLFTPAKSGLDVVTQIYDGELFDYGIEVRPILDVLVGKTIEQALLEVMEEEELANLRVQQRAFEELRNAEIAEQQRLEEQHKRLQLEKRNRMLDARRARQIQEETKEKIAARVFTQAFLRDLVPAVFGQLSDYGYFYDPVERDLEQNFMSWLSDAVVLEVEKAELGRLVVDGLIREVVIRTDTKYRHPDRLTGNVAAGSKLGENRLSSLTQLIRRLKMMNPGGARSVEDTASTDTLGGGPDTLSIVEEEDEEALSETNFAFAEAKSSGS